MTHIDSTSSPERDTPKTYIEVVAHSFSELEDLLTRPRAAREPLLVRLEGPAAEDLLGEGMAVRVVATAAKEVAA